MATRTEKSTTGYLNVDITADTTAKRTLRNINPDCTNFQFATALLAISAVQSHTLNTDTPLIRTNKATITAV